MNGTPTDNTRSENLTKTRLGLIEYKQVITTMAAVLQRLDEMERHFLALEEGFATSAESVKDLKEKIEEIQFVSPTKDILKVITDKVVRHNAETKEKVATMGNSITRNHAQLDQAEIGISELNRRVKRLDEMERRFLALEEGFATSAESVKDLKDKIEEIQFVSVTEDIEVETKEKVATMGNSITRNHAQLDQAEIGISELNRRVNHLYKKLADAAAVRTAAQPKPQQKAAATPLDGGRPGR